MSRILLLEDHDSLRRSMATALEELPDAQVYAARTLEDAIEHLSKEQPDLIVSDLDLPDGSGVDLLAYLGRPPSVPVVFVSGHVPRYRSKLKQFPGITVRHKPIALRELQDVALEHLESVVNEAPFGVSDYIQLACIGRHSVRIEVEATDELRGVITVKGGQLWSAEYGVEQGLSALRRLAFETKAFIRCVTVRNIRAERNLPQKSWEQLLLDAAKSHDESKKAMTNKKVVAPKVEDETDFSALFDDDDDALPLSTATRPSPPRIAVPATKTPPDPLRTTTPAPVRASRPTPPRPSPEAEYRSLLDRGAEALLNRDYERALSLYESARAINPNDPLVAANVARLTELASRTSQ